MVHIALAGLRLVQTVQSLCLGKWSQCCDRTDLRLSSRKHGRTMYSRNQIYLRSQRTDLVDLTSVRTLMVLQDHLTNRLLLILIDSISQKWKPLLLFCKCFLQPVCDRTDICLSRLLVIGKHRLFHLFRRNDLFDRCEQLLRYGKTGVAVLLFSTFCHDRINKFNDLLVYLMSRKDRIDHLCLRNLICSGLNHNDLISRGCYRKLKIGSFLLCCCRIEDKLTIYQSHLCRCTGTVKRNI